MPASHPARRLRASRGRDWRWAVVTRAARVVRSSSLDDDDDDGILLYYLLFYFSFFLSVSLNFRGEGMDDRSPNHYYLWRRLSIDGVGGRRMMVLSSLSRANEGVTLRGTPSSLDLAWMRMQGLLRWGCVVGFFYFYLLLMLVCFVGLGCK